jgi:hypothetical protein
MLGLLSSPTGQKPRGKNVFADHFFHRVLAAFLAIADRFCGDSAAALAAPPFNPPSFPKAAAVGLFAGGAGSSGSPDSFSPMACSTTRRPMAMKSCSLSFPERLGIQLTLCHRGAVLDERILGAVFYRQIGHSSPESQTDTPPSH